MTNKLHEVAPPGREKQVKELKKKFPKSSAFAIAWASYNKSHHHKEETEGKHLWDIILESDDEEKAHHLVMSADSESHLYHTSKAPVMKNLEKKHKKGVYDHEKAKKLWKYHADRAAQHVHRQHGDSSQHWSKAYSPGVRRKAASIWADHHHTEMKLGNYHD